MFTAPLNLAQITSIHWLCLIKTVESINRFAYSLHVALPDEVATAKNCLRTGSGSHCINRTQIPMLRFPSCANQVLSRRKCIITTSYKLKGSIGRNHLSLHLNSPINIKFTNILAQWNQTADMAAESHSLEGEQTCEKWP